MDRKDFLFKIGVGTAVVVSGYFLWDSGYRSDTKKEPVSADKPKLNVNVKSREENGMFVLYYEKKSCFVNNTGQQIISRLNGKKTIIEIAKEISQNHSIEYSDLVLTSVVSFVCQLAVTGFLSSPFYATFYENFS